MPRCWQQLLQHGGVHRRLIGDDLDGRDLGRAKRPLEAPVCGACVAAGRHEHVDDLPEPVDRAVDVPPAAGHPDGGLVHEPAVADGVPARPGGLGQQGCETQHPPVDGDVVDLNAAFDQEFFESR
jgi:hypothetical protein